MFAPLHGLPDQSPVRGSIAKGDTILKKKPTIPAFNGLNILARVGTKFENIKWNVSSNNALLTGPIRHNTHLQEMTNAMSAPSTCHKEEAEHSYHN